MEIKVLCEVLTNYIFFVALFHLIHHVLLYATDYVPKNTQEIARVKYQHYEPESARGVSNNQNLFDFGLVFQGRLSPWIFIIDHLLEPRLINMLNLLHNSPRLHHPEPLLQPDTFNHQEQ